VLHLPGPAELLFVPRFADADRERRPVVEVPEGHLDPALQDQHALVPGLVGELVAQRVDHVGRLLVAQVREAEVALVEELEENRSEGRIDELDRLGRRQLDASDLDVLEHENRIEVLVEGHVRFRSLDDVELLPRLNRVNWSTDWSRGL